MFDKNREYEIRIACNHEDQEMKDTPIFWCIIQDGANNGHNWSKTIESAFHDANTYINQLQ